MSGVTELSYVVYEVSDLADWERFGVELLGMQYGGKTTRGFTLRTDDKAHRWVIEEGAEDDLVASGYSVASAAELDALAGKLRADGVAVTEGDAALAAERKVDRIVITTDPMGNRIELVTGFADAGTPFESERLLGGFVTGTGGAGHQVLLSGGVGREDYLHFYNDLLGFRTSDIIVEEVAPGVFADLIFLHCNPRHHSVALGDMPFPKRNHHFMVEVSDIRDVGLAWDRCLAAHQPFHMTLGMHPNDMMFSFYVETPSGFNVEYGWGGLLIDDATWEVKTLDQLNSWGHLPAGPVAEMLAAGAANSKIGH
ncbi:Biphenyl-2,3-diol 1,2-dioxygenase [Streptomyces sp. RB5]|uniref:Biphenyl-2,3-diol 1,2-dioxygenase n=1 Tax=Streptomyces smaragdinus TaxID=2585196 RepID=A0A7K0CQW4_9ACTN|nr:VOC family protein [Streptomyces smaragdinus]MQY15875.1 Biphenyl-2,3-diol 1,2-dioxygenase [Streptomyces smaragdinus]